MHFELDTLNETVDSCHNKVNHSLTVVIKVHQPCGFSLVVIGFDYPKPAFVKSERPENCTEPFIDVLEKFAEDIYEKKKEHSRWRL